MAEAKHAAADTGTPTMADRKRRHAAKAGGLPALVVLATTAIAQNAPPVQTASALPASEKAIAGSPKISYVGGQLKIDALGCTLAEVLTKVAALTGVTIDLPPGANTERMPIVDLGPGPAREVVASLLSDSSFDYVIQASETDPEKLKNVLVMAREKKGSGPIMAEARPARNAYGRVVPAAKTEEPPPPENPVEAKPEVTATAEATPPPETPAQPEQTTPRVDQSAQSLMPGVVQTNVPKTFPVPVPQVLDQQNINQTLQQMYQQRVQMNQTMAPTANPGGK